MVDIVPNQKILFVKSLRKILKKILSQLRYFFSGGHGGYKWRALF